MEKPQILSPCSSRRSGSSVPNSPEFEFWMLRNPSFPQPNLSSADELFSGGVLLPLHPSNDPPPPPPPPQHHEASGSGQLSVSEPDPPTIDTWTTSKRWIDIFKKDDHNNKEKNRKKKKNSSSGSVVAAELNIINIWPFSRSKSAGNGGARPRAAARKVSSAPCSRSNSTARKWPPNSPSRGGVHLGRSSPVWHVRRGGGGGRNSEPIFKKDGNEGRRKKPAAAPEVGGGSKGRLLSLNVPMCIGYRHNLSCRSDENSALASTAISAAVGGGGGCSEIGGAVSGGGVRRSHLFNIRSLFTKKVY